MTYTPGPWTLEGNSHGNKEVWAFFKNGSNRWIATVNNAADIIDPDDGKPCHARQEEQANARLIAAAPEILSCLQSLADWVEESFDEDERPQWLPDVFAAIAKAKGD